MKTEISKGLRLFYGVGDFAFAMMTNIELYFWTFFLTNFALFDLATVAIITTVASTVDAALSWIYGAIIDSLKPMKWGRYRSYLVALPWLVPFLYAFQFIKIGSDAVAAVIIIVAAITSHVVWNLGYVANVSLIPIAAKKSEDRASLTAARGAWNNLSKVLFSYTVIPLLAVFGNMLGDANKYAAMAFVLGALMAILYFVHFKLFEGYEETAAEEAANPVKKEKMSVGVLAKSLFTNGPLMVLLIVDLAKWMYNFIVGGVAAYYFTYVAQNPALLPVYLLIANILGVFGAYLSQIIAKKLSSRNAAIYLMFMMSIALILAKLLYASAGVGVVIVLLSIAQFGYGAVYALTPALYSDCAVYSNWKTGQSAAGWVMGLQNLPLKVAVVTRGLTITTVLAVAKFDATVDPSLASDTLKAGITTGFMLIPAIAVLVGAVLLTVGYKLTKEKLAQYQDEIAQRDA